MANVSLKILEMVYIIEAFQILNDKKMIPSALNRLSYIEVLKKFKKVFRRKINRDYVNRIITELEKGK